MGAYSKQFGNDNEPEETPEEAEARAAKDAKRAKRLEQIAEELGLVYRRLEQLARYTKDNCSAAEWEQVQARRKKAFEDKVRLENEWKALIQGDKNLPIVRPTLCSVLDEIVAQANRFFVFTDPMHAYAIALWVVYSHVFLLQIFQHAPFLMLHSKEPGSGKTYVAEFIEELAANVLMTSSITGSRLEMLLERAFDDRNNPFLVKYWNDNGLLGLGLLTLLFDEADRYTDTNLLMRLLHACHRKRGGFISKKGRFVRCFAPVGVFRLNDPRLDPNLRAFVSRSLVIEIKKRDPDNPEHERDIWDEDNRRKLPQLRQQISLLVQECKDDFKKWRPEKGGWLSKGNRPADNWRPAFAIAELAGGHWVETVRKIASTPDPEPVVAPPVAAAAAAGGGGGAASHHAVAGNEREKAKIVAHLNRHGGRCSRTDLYANVFQMNLSSERLAACIAELVAQGLVKTHMAAPMGAGGRYTQIIELVPPEAPQAAAPASPKPHHKRMRRRSSKKRRRRTVH
jgi:hypothetical protein